MDQPRRIARRGAWGMLIARTLLFLAFQIIIGAAFLAARSTAPWQASATWWPVAATLTNLTCILLLIRLFRDEGKRYWDLFRFDRGTWRADLLWLLALGFIIGPVGFFPNLLLGEALFGTQ
jgi:hypothetical protein